MTAATRTPVRERFELAAAFLVLAGVGHVLAIPDHADPGHGGVLYGAAFATVATAQLFAASSLARARGASRRGAVIVGTAVLVGIWAVSRTVGLPFGPHPGVAEAAGVLDGLTVAAQLAVLGLLAGNGRRMRPPMAFAASLAITVVVAIAVFNLAGPTEPAGAVSHRHEQPAPGQGHPQDDPDGTPARQPAGPPSDHRERADGADAHPTTALATPHTHP